MTASSLLLLISGFVLLVAGGEALVRGAASLGRTVGLSSLMIGLTVVAFATSAPKLAISVGAAFAGSPGLSVGTVVGSNIANILFVLGLTAVFSGLMVNVKLIKVDIPVLIGFSGLALALALDGSFSTLDGMILLGLLILYLIVSAWYPRRQHDAAQDEQLRVERVLTGGPGGRIAARLRATPLRSTTVDVILLLGGVGMLALGARLLVDAATSISQALGVSDLVIGVTAVTIGISLPALTTSVIAVLRGQRDMAVGNVVGSCLFNLGAVLGITSIVSPGDMSVAPAAVYFDLPLMVAAALILLPLTFNGRGIPRWQGGAMAGLYAAYVVWRVLTAGGGPQEELEPFSPALLWFLVSLTGLGLTAIVSSQLRLARHQGRFNDEEEEPVDYLSSPAPHPSSPETRHHTEHWTSDSR